MKVWKIFLFTWPFVLIVGVLVRLNNEQFPQQKAHQGVLMMLVWEDKCGNCEHVMKI